MLSAKQIEKIMCTLHDNFSIRSRPEITIECNPNSLTEAKLRAYKKLGINRLSIGIQSHDTVILKMLGRTHSSEGAIKSLRMASKYFNNINIDFIYNVPIPRDFSQANLKRDIEGEINFILNSAPDVTHVSAYALIIEPGTQIARRVDYEELYELDEDSCIDEELALHFTLRDHGFKRYEVSNWARPGFECQHNKNYWSADTEYLGLGVAASGMFDNTRYENTDDLNLYLLSQNKVKSTIRRTTHDTINEMIMLGLRTKRGIDLGRLNAYGVNLLLEKSREILELSNMKIIKVTDKKISATQDGFFILNLIIQKLTLDVKELGVRG